MPLFKVKENISVGSDLETSKALVKLMKDSEEEYQSGISENYQVNALYHYHLVFGTSILKPRRCLTQHSKPCAGRFQ